MNTVAMEPTLLFVGRGSVGSDKPFRCDCGNVDKMLIKEKRRETTIYCFGLFTRMHGDV